MAGRFGSASISKLVDGASHSSRCPLYRRMGDMDHAQQDNISGLSYPDGGGSGTYRCYSPSFQGTGEDLQDLTGEGGTD